jgi:hypothetical protein
MDTVGSSTMMVGSATGDSLLHSVSPICGNATQETLMKSASVVAMHAERCATAGAPCRALFAAKRFTNLQQAQSSTDVIIKSKVSRWIHM